jgi:hypothetical protein
VLSLILACLLASPAASLTLGDLANGAPLSTLDGALTFDNFVVTLDPIYDGSPNLLAGLDLDNFEVEVFDSSFGFRVLELDGPMSAFPSTVGNMVIEFDVMASAGWQILSVGLGFVSTAVGPPAYAAVTETIEGASGNITTLNAIRQAGGAQNPSDIAVLADPETKLHVTKDIVVDARNGGILASISEIEQSFETAIPEPSAAMLFGVGSLLFGAGIRRGRPA